MEFNFSALPWQIIFGAGALQKLPSELDERRLERVLILSTPGQRRLAEAVKSLIGQRCAGIFDQAYFRMLCN